MSRFQNKLLTMIMGCLLVVSMLALSREAARYTVSRGLQEEAGRACVVIDAGHGGRDPGKVGVNGALEKDINLSIALKLKEFLEEDGVDVVLTREGDEGLYREDAPNKKVQDMKRRIEIIDAALPKAAVSIHQNSYPEEYVHGAQVFYYGASAEGKKLAESLTESLEENKNFENVRPCKPNESYYLLKKTSSCAVIVECGFLSNRNEADKLCDDLYQERIAWTVHMGIMKYLNSLQP